MDKSTLGGDKASVVLAEMLGNVEKKTKHRVLSIYNDYMIGLKDINNLKNSNMRIRMSLLWLDHFKEKVIEVNGFYVRTHLITVMTTRRRDIVLRVLS